jgi:hypothetical protein
MKRNQEPRMNAQTNEMVVRTMIGTASAHADGQAIHTEKAAAERQQKRMSRKMKSRRGTAPTSMGQSPSRMSTSQSVSTTTKQSRYNFGKQRKTTQAIHKEVLDEEKLQELCLDATKRVIENHI